MGTNIDFALPTFDHDSPSFRRFKPLPKRRRTAGLQAMSNEIGPNTISSFQFQGSPALAALADLHAKPYFNQLSAQKAVRDLFSNEGADPTFLADFKALYTNPIVAPAVPALQDHDEQLESDYVDHLQLPTNTKKRKVPSLARPTAMAGDSVSSLSGAALGLSISEPSSPLNEGALQLAAHRLLADGPHDIDGLNATIHSSTAGDAPLKYGRESIIARAIKRNKTMISARKKQFAAVLKGGPESDSLALELALSARYPQLDGTYESKSTTIYRSPRKLRTKNRTSQPFSSHIAVGTAPSSQFAFSCPCSISERLATIKRETAKLQALFEEELSHQAVRAVEAAAKAAAALEPRSKSRKRTGASNRSAFPLPPARIDSDSHSGDQSLLNKGKQKKKKRSALANASNPHHLRNYVPSRLPQQPLPITQTSLAAANFLSPPPLRFLSAQIPPRRRKRTAIPVSSIGPALTSPMDEWICPNCEYNLFYGDESAFRRSVRSRKKILSRRRRARERAAAAASGIAPIVPEKSIPPEQDDDDSYAKTASPNSVDQYNGKRDSQISGADISDTLK